MEKDKNKFHELLMLFDRNVPKTYYAISKKHKNIIDEAVEKKYILEVGEDDTGQKLYIISNLGIQLRDY